MRKPVAILAILMLAIVQLAASSKVPVKAVEAKQTNITAVDREALISFARHYLGTPYHYASSNPKKGFDCSGFVNFVFKNFKINLPRSSREFKNMGKDLKPEEFKVGDVVVFRSFRNKARIGHVGIICEANGLHSKFIHSATSQRRGVVVSDLASGTYAHRFFRCIDVIDRK
ncbi:MAG: C40 family peptidase [Prolixibacteraceae bacterium]|jgi:cell wall-associated NlpC family hydrolase|nr:C40 family peptidase [Prolixibacteraceae bacterium]